LIRRGHFASFELKRKTKISNLAIALTKLHEFLILNIRNQKVILDVDLAEIYGVLTKVFNQAVKRNSERFPDDFVFQLTAEKFAALRTPDSSPMAMSSSQPFENEGALRTGRKRNFRHRPYALEGSLEGSVRN
jgi:hypothetical protein